MSTEAGVRIGDRARIERICRAEDLIVFAHASGDLNPLHLPAADKDGDGRPDGDADAIAPAMWVGSLFSAVLGNVLPGPGTTYLAQSLAFHRSVRIGDALTVEVEVIATGADRVVTLACRVMTPEGAMIADGEARVRAPQTPLTLDPATLPRLVVTRHRHAERMLAACEGLAPLKVAVVSPEEAKALGGALTAMRRGLIAPVLVGDPALVRATAAAMDADIRGIDIVEAHSHSEAAARAVALVHEGRAEALMKGALHTDELLKHVVKAEGGLRAGRRISHVFTFDVPGLDYLLHVSDAAIAIAPTLEEKVDIVQNAIDLARALGSACPRVGVLAAVETVNPRMPATIDAAALSKMSERGQIKGGVVDGPLAMDNAMDAGAARTKGVKGLVAGRAEVLIAPNIEAGNILAKELAFISHAEGAGLVLGAKVPVILTSRADDEMSRLMSCAMALLWREWRATGQSRMVAD